MPYDTFAHRDRPANLDVQRVALSFSQRGSNFRASHAQPDIGGSSGPPAALVTLYDLYPAAIVIGLPATGFSSGEAMAPMEDTATRMLPPGTGFDWSAMAYQEKVAGGQI